MLVGFLLLASGTVLAEQSMLEGVATEAAKETVTAVAPTAAATVEATKEKATEAVKTVNQKAKKIKKKVQATPKAVKSEITKEAAGKALEEMH